MMTVNTACRDCGSKNLVKFLDLGTQALANSFVRQEDLTQPEPAYPLEVYFCTDCHLAQLIHVVDKAELFRHYVYFSSGMPKVSPHWEAYAKDVMNRFLAKGDFVVEVGSNDGILLNFFKESGYRVLGVDPAENIAKVAEERGVPTMATFFTEEVAKEIAEKHGPADAILANNVFAHIDTHQDFCKAAKTLLSDTGVLVIEAPYLIDMFENLAYDTVYHEHLSFLAVDPLVRLFKAHGLELFEVQIVEAQGNSLRLFVGHEGAHPMTDSVAALLAKEKELGLDSIEAYNVLAERVKASTEKLVALLKDLKAEGKTIYGYGAPAKGNTLLNYAQIGPELVTYVLDDLPSKQGLLSPGMHIPVVTRDFVRENPPDYYLMLAWNYKKPILEREEAYRAAGGKFIIPIGDDIEII